MGVDIDALIVEVRKRPQLYNTSNKEYHDRRLKKELWAEVCCSLRSAEIWNSMNSKNKMKYEKEVLTKWNSLRTCFRRELRINKFYADGIPERKKRKYIYFDGLLFLLPFTKVIDKESSLENDQASDLSNFSEEDNSETKSLISQTEKTICETYEEPMMPIAKLIKTESSLDIQRNSESELSDGESSVNQTGCDFKNANTKKKKRNQNSDEEPRQVMRKDTRLLGIKRISTVNEVDDDEAFLSSLLPSLKEFSTEDKLRLRIELLTTILNFKKSLNSGLSTENS